MRCEIDKLCHGEFLLYRTNAYNSIVYNSKKVSFYMFTINTPPKHRSNLVMNRRDMIEWIKRNSSCSVCMMI
nr:MAG TPA: hypothetical protein [Caudoviricetes sp.]